jgi:alpha-glucosidase
LPYLSDLGVDGFWLSPIYPSPLADGGYDITDHAGVHPLFGSLDDFDRLLAEAHARGLRVILDLVPSHTSIEHPWFREHPDWYVWSDDGPANNWLSAFGGSAWSRDDATGRWYLHSFYPEQPDLDWRHPEVRRAVGDVIRFWSARGVDGFRVDAVDRLAKDPELRDDPPALEPWSLPLPAEYAALHHVHSRSASGIGDVLASIREAAGDAFLVGEVFRPTAELALYLEHFDAVFAFEFMFAAWEPEAYAPKPKINRAPDPQRGWNDGRAALVWRPASGRVERNGRPRPGGKSSRRSNRVQQTTQVVSSVSSR